MCAISESDSSRERTTRDGADVLDGEFAGEDDAREAEVLHRLRTGEIVNRHLRRGVEREAGRVCLGNLRDAEVLDERGVGTGGFEELQVISDACELLVEHHRIHRDVDAYAAQVGVADGGRERVFVEVVRIGARTEAAACEIHGIGTGFDGCTQRVGTAGRGE